MGGEWRQGFASFPDRNRGSAKVMLFRFTQERVSEMCKSAGVRRGLGEVIVHGMGLCVGRGPVRWGKA